MPVPDHVADLQILDGDLVVLTHQAGGEFVQEVAPCVGHPGVGPRGLHTRFGPVLAAFLAAGDPALPALEVPLVPLPVPGMGIFSPVDKTARSARPRSTPTLWPIGGSGTGSGTSTLKVTNQRPAGSLVTVTEVGSSLATSTRGQVHTNGSGASVLASQRAPPLMRNADRGKVA